MIHDLRSKSVSTKVSEAELRVLESRAERAGLTLSEWVRDVLLGSSVDAGAMGGWPSHEPAPTASCPIHSAQFAEWVGNLRPLPARDPVRAPQAASPSRRVLKSSTRAYHSFLN